MTASELIRRVRRKLVFLRHPPAPFPIDAWADPSYPAWLEAHRPSAEELDEQRAAGVYADISFSILVPLYQTPLEYLSDLVESVLLQTHENFELILVNGSPDDRDLAFALTVYAEADSRVRVVDLEENRGIAGNTAAGLLEATGEYVLLVDHDDVIEPYALFEYAKAIHETPDASLYYCDEDLFEADEETGERRYLHPLFKPDLSPSLLACKNYILHMLCFKRAWLEEAGIPDASFDGAQDYKMIIDALDHDAHACHIPQVLYHWRMSEASTAANPDSKPYGKVAYRRCLELISQEHWDSANVIPTATENLFDLWNAGEPQGRVSLIVDAFKVRDLGKSLQWLTSAGISSGLDLIIVGAPKAGVTDLGVTTLWVDALKDDKLFARLNKGAQAASGDYLVFMDARSAFTTDEPFQQLMLAVSRDWIGVASPKVLYSDGTIKGYGVAVTSERIMPLYRGYPEDFPGYQCGLQAFQESSACGWQGAMLERELFQRVGGFDVRFEGEVGMAELCQRIRLEGLTTAQVCTVTLQTTEGRPDDRFNNNVNAPDFTTEDIALFDEKWPGARAAGDPYFNRNLDQSSSYFQIAEPSKEGR